MKKLSLLEGAKDHLHEQIITQIPGIDEWLTTEQAARYLGVSAASLRNMTSNGQIPYYKLGKRNRYRLPELRELLLLTRKGEAYGI